MKVTCTSSTYKQDPVTKTTTFEKGKTYEAVQCAGGLFVKDERGTKHFVGRMMKAVHSTFTHTSVATFEK
jgi:hypothetical protein